MTVTTDHARIGELLDRLLAADPVRNTVLGTVRADLSDTAWCAWTLDGDAVAVRCGAQYLVVTTGAWDDRDLAELGELLARLPGLCGLSGSGQMVARLDHSVQRLAPRPVVHRMAQRLFRLDSLTEPAVAGGARKADRHDRAVVADWYAAFAAEAAVGEQGLGRAIDAAVAGQGWLWCDPAGRPVSVAARRPVVSGSARIGPVYTPPELRGHGYGSAVTAAATRDVLDDGAVPVLFTDLANPASNAIYPRLGYYPVGDFAAIRYR